MYLIFFLQVSVCVDVTCKVVNRPSLTNLHTMACQIRSPWTGTHTLKSQPLTQDYSVCQYFQPNMSHQKLERLKPTTTSPK